MLEYSLGKPVDISLLNELTNPSNRSISVLGTSLRRFFPIFPSLLNLWSDIHYPHHNKIIWILALDYEYVNWPVP